MFFDAEAKRCCRLCPMGQYVEKPCAAPLQDPVCKPCDEGTYLAYSNYLTKCKLCTTCDLDTEVEKVSCSETTNAECVCKESFYWYEEQRICKACTKCNNRSTIQNCSTRSNTQCGGCLPGFYEENNECSSCLPSGEQCEMTKSSCPPVCAPVVSIMPYVLTGTFLLLLLLCGGLLIHKHKRKKKHSKGEHVIKVHGGGDVPGLTAINQDTGIVTPDTTGHVFSILQRSSTLYHIIDCVPVRRWKEFMRTLELPDKVIEIVEVEISNFRDQQYEMLRRWCQLKMASVDAVYETLERMNLSGCAEELKEKIEHYS
ncbi:tumor necrosis factor receptor superfamily member 25 [Bufo gargarizans]|uniref:tumor necrosis factor receptor superfamily member 25 n=1 Tax=Bufo gargarizans TaxID=30331 RepID=UPI001CF38842|nr:tumor necrosis factor receptor superfamily member 25 [Bufo gargarizans]